MKIKKIVIKHCRGIKDLTIVDEIFPNKPHILVAPNGFGKTSFAHAFSSIAKHRSEKINDDDRYDGDKNNKAEIELEVSENDIPKTLRVDENDNSNTIIKEFDIIVITNPSHIKAVAKNFGSNFSTPTGKMVIDPIVICKKIKKTDMPISKTKLQKEFGKNGSKLFDIELLFKNQSFANYSICCVSDIACLSKGNIFNKLEKIRDLINDMDFSEEETHHEISDLNEIIKNNIKYRYLNSFFTKIFNCSKIQAFSLIWFLVYLCRNDKKRFQEYFKFERYNFYKTKLKSVIENLNSSKYKQASVCEQGGDLQVRIPEPKFLSNGQRDVLILVAFLYQAQMQLTKKNSIIIIDELFDYLDDANLTVAQYYISQLMEDFHNSSRNLFPLLLTHLNPEFFRNYVFQHQKIIYLNKQSFSVTPTLQKLINIRTDARIKDNVSKFLFHYHPNNFDFSKDLQNFKGICEKWGTKDCFLNFLTGEYNKYKSNGSEKFDPLAVCAYTRVTIEKKVYESLKEGKEEFLAEHCTRNKLKLASAKGVEMPEIYYLLHIIYDEAMHSTTGKNNTASIEAKLTNPIIKEMIIDAIEN